jgi:hypothetical protein
VDVYVIFRNGSQLATVNVPATTYRDDSVAPGKSYTYGIEAGRSRTFSQQVTTTADVAKIPLSRAVLRGTYDIEGPITSQSGYVQTQTRFSAGWRLRSACPDGPCTARWTFLGFSKIKGTLKPSDGAYSGTATGQYNVRCGSAIVVSVVTVTLHVVKARAVDGRWVATKLTGTIDQTESSQLGCVSSVATANVTGRLVA